MYTCCNSVTLRLQFECRYSACPVFLAARKLQSANECAFVRPRAHVPWLGLYPLWRFMTPANCLRLDNTGRFLHQILECSGIIFILFLKSSKLLAISCFKNSTQDCIFLGICSISITCNKEKHKLCISSGGYT